MSTYDERSRAARGLSPQRTPVSGPFNAFASADRAYRQPFQNMLGRPFGPDRDIMLVNVTANRDIACDRTIFTLDFELIGKGEPEPQEIRMAGSYHTRYISGRRENAPAWVTVECDEEDLMQFRDPEYAVARAITFVSERGLLPGERVTVSLHELMHRLPPSAVPGQRATVSPEKRRSMVNFGTPLDGPLTSTTVGPTPDELESNYRV